MSVYGIGRLVLLSSLLPLLILACGDDNGGSTGPDPTGSLEVSLTIAGGSQDADGCVFTVDGASSRRIAAGESTTYTSLSVGQHEVAISDVAGNCQVLGDETRSVAVVADQTAAVIYAVDCSTPLGSIAVSASTSGEDQDDNGYEIVVDGGAPSTIGINGSITAGALTPGDYSVELQGEAFNCFVAGDNPRTVSVTAGVETPVTFDVICRYHLYDRIVFQSWRTGSAILHAVDPQNPGIVRPLDILGEHPAVTKDGLRIAYDWDLDIWVADSDGGNAVNLTQSVDQEQFAIWSPDGSRIVFRRGIGLWVMNADGSDQSYLGIDGWKPTWSPDGSRIAFTSIGGGTNLEIWVMNADGSGSPLNVTNDPGWDAYPAWSPLGNYIAFSSTRNGSLHIYVVDPGGGPATPMTTSLISTAFYPTWAPEAVAGAFQSDAAGNEDIYYFDPTGGGAVQLTTSTAQDLQPFWGGGN